jgi:hypothetical protein
LSERAAYGSGRVITDGVVRAGIVHHNTPDEVDRLLEGWRGRNVERAAASYRGGEAVVTAPRRH